MTVSTSHRLRLLPVMVLLELGSDEADIIVVILLTRVGSARSAPLDWEKVRDYSVSVFVV